ncbi:MAG: hypothetical protein JSS72_10030 [Armatimonadetes bacterium]|nr:hypothetical protein [Armatimonadota bacterium]
MDEAASNTPSKLLINLITIVGVFMIMIGAMYASGMLKVKVERTKDPQHGILPTFRVEGGHSGQKP